MAQIVPAILEETKEGFLEKVSKVVKLSGLERIQVDFGDGIFIPAKLLSPDEIDGLNPALHWEAHLMVKEPENFLDYQIAGFKTIIIHFDAFDSRIGIGLALKEIKKLGMKAGITTHPDNDLADLAEFSDKVDLFLVMGVVPGRQGQSFIEDTPKRIAYLKSLVPNAIIEADGGANENNIKSIKDAGADLICVGSALVKATDLNLAYEKLQKEIQ